MKRILSILVLLSVVLTGLCLGSYATGETAEYCFAETDFREADASLDGIFLAQVPEENTGVLFLGNRQLRAGDVIPSGSLEQLRLVSDAHADGETSVVFCPISQGHLSQETVLKVPLGNKKNLPPQTKDSTFETYKNIANTGTLSVTDPENDVLTFTIVKEPKRGTVVLGEDGTFTYTPKENKVGKDSFVFTATDPAGNTSEEATVSVQILKPLDKATYSDMADDPDHFYAVWMREQGLFSGETVTGNLCFNPEKHVTRGEFLAMTMDLLDAKPQESVLTSGFADEEDAPLWMQPYLVSALKSGMVSGVTTDNGVVFRPATSLTKAEAVVMVQNALRLPSDAESPVFAENTNLPVWAQSSYTALTSAGFQLDPAFSAEPMTRREVSKLLYAVSVLTEENQDLSFPWANG